MELDGASTGHVALHVCVGAVCLLDELHQLSYVPRSVLRGWGWGFAAYLLRWHYGLQITPLFITSLVMFLG